MSFVRGLLCAVLLLPALARADLLLHPTRLVFEKNQRTAQIELINNGTEPATYRISLVNKRMSETGQFTNADTAQPGERFADQLVRYAPRQVTLLPGAAQTVRVMLRKPGDLARGEYPPHLQFDRVAPQQAPPAASAAAATEVGVQISVMVGASIPVIVRNGDLAPSTAALSQLTLVRKGDAPALSFVIERAGEASVYGDLEATFTAAGGQTQRVGQAAGLAVYTPNPLRRATLPLTAPAGGLAHGTLHLTLRARPDAGGAILAQADLAIP
jgi:P pilus assembly chaperone PapD